MALKETIHPIIAQKAVGSHVTDVDGHDVIDVSGGFGPIIFGHNAPFVREAVCNMMNKDGWALGYEHQIVGEASKKFCQVTGNERVTWVNTGTEATTLAMRLCRLYNGRKKIVMFLGSYHGHFDGFLGIPTKMDAPDNCVAVAGGIARGFVQDLVVLEYDSIESLEWIEKHSDEIAGVYCETVQNRSPRLVPRAFLQKLRELCTARGMVLVFDEVVTGFRIGPGGAQSYFGIRADLVSYGKALGGGFPVGALGGRAEVMTGVDGGVWQYGDSSQPAGRRTFFAGTTCKHPLVMAAVCAVLDHIIKHGDEMYPQINSRIDRFVTTMNGWWKTHGHALRVDNFGTQFRFQVPADIAMTFYQTLKMNGLYTWEGRTCYLFTTHSEKDIDAMITACKTTTLMLLRHKIPLPRADSATSGVPPLPVAKTAFAIKVLRPRPRETKNGASSKGAATHVASSTNASDGSKAPPKAIKPYDVAQGSVAMVPELVAKYTLEHAASRKYMEVMSAFNPHF